MQAICIIIPCYNESMRLDLQEFRKFVSENSWITFCFVNDGSKDNTSALLQDFEKENSEKIKILNLVKNSGKAEAIRNGAIAMMELNKFELIGYFDSDLSAPLAEIAHLAEEIQRKPSFSVVFGSRLKLMGREINRRALRHYLGRGFATMASILVGLPIYDTQCGAKLFKTELVPVFFSKPFITRWFFDLEMLFRLKCRFGKDKTLEMVAESPVYEWIEKKGSKLKIFDFIKVPFQLIRIYFYYRKFDPTAKPKL